MNKQDLKDKLFKVKYGFSKDLLREMLAVSLAVILTLSFWTLLFHAI